MKNDPEYAKAYREANKEQIRAQQKEYYQKNAKEIQANRVGYRIANKSKIRDHKLKKRMENPAQALFNYAKRRARLQGLPFDIEVTDIVIPTHCPYLGIEIQLTPKGAAKAFPNSPSLDRIRPDLGYVKGNVIVVSHRANRLKDNATPDELETIAKAVRSLIEIKK